MKRSFSRRIRHRSKPAKAETVFFKREAQYEGSAFGENGNEMFFSPAAVTSSPQTVNRKCEDCAKEDQQVQRVEDKKEEEKVMKAEDKKEEEKVMKAEDKKEEEKVQRAEDKKEEEKVMKAEDKKEEEKVQKAEDKKEEEKVMKAEDKKEEEKVQKKEVTGSNAVTNGAGGYISGLNGKGNSLPQKSNYFFSSRMGYDFSDVRIHNDKDAHNSAKELRARAYTVGNNIVFNEGQYDTESHEGKKLMAHELTHVAQQNKRVWPKVQRRLFVSGANVANPTEYLDLVGTAGGLRLRWSFANPRVFIIGDTVTPPTSASARNILTQIINHPTQHAEIFVGTHQPRISIGGFPGGGSTIQDVDIDDIRNLNAALPGQGTAKAFHEMFENFTAHTPGGLGPFGPAHGAAVEAESNVAEDLGIAGRRLDAASITTPIPDFLAALLGLATGPGISYQLNRQIFTHYFLDMIRRRTVTPAGPDFEIVTAFRTPKTQISQVTIDNFVSGSNAVPPTGAANLAATLAVLNANPASTLLIEGFADSQGGTDFNQRLSRQRAASAQAFFIANGITANRIAIVGRGETNFVGPNNTAAGRAQNRRVVLTVHN